MSDIITHTWFETALDYRPFLHAKNCLVHKLYLTLTTTILTGVKMGLKNIQTAGCNGMHKVFAVCTNLI